MQMLLATLELGGSGATMPPPAAEIARQVIDAFVAGDGKRAAEIQLQFSLFPSKWMHRGLTATMKTAMRLIGFRWEISTPRTFRSILTKRLAWRNICKPPSFLRERLRMRTARELSIERAQLEKDVRAVLVVPMWAGAGRACLYPG